MKGQYFWCLLSGLISIVQVVSLRAGPSEDSFGAGSRVQAMGGAGVALSQDASSAFYNPALLTKCPKQTLSLGYQLMRTNLKVQDSKKETLQNKQLGLLQTANLGVCLSPFTNFGFGLYASFPAQLPLRLPSIESLNATPQFLMYGDNAVFPSVIVGLAYAPIRQLSFGLAAAISASVAIQQSMHMPVFAATVSPQLSPAIQLIAGVAGEPVEKLRLSFVYRQAGFGRFDVDVDTKAFFRIPGLGNVGDASLPFLLGSVLSYSPAQIAFGLSYQPDIFWLIGADVTHYQWSDYTGPFMSARAKKNTWGAYPITFPPEEILSFRDTFVPRLGLECRLNEKVKIRAGYAFHMSPAPVPSKISNLLDNNVHRVTLGGGYRLVSLTDLTIILDAFVAVDVMLQRSVKKVINKLTPNQPTDYNFGGTAMSAGLTLKAEY